jgi:hypothetical protein
LPCADFDAKEALLNFSASRRRRPLRRGDVVEVKSAAEILATLDGNASINAMPFMPEMMQYLGRRFTVSRRVDKICDTIAWTGSRRMHDTVYLEDLRCDGSHHAGCQAGCKIYWKEAWLRKVGDETAPASTNESESATTDLEKLAVAGTRTVREFDGVPTEVWRCQATEALKATEHLRGYDLRPHWRELTNGNFEPLRFFRILSYVVYLRIRKALGLLKPLPLHGAGDKQEHGKPLNLQPGELVQVLSPEEIAPTLDETGLNFGLSFDREMMPYCGKTLRVKDRVRTIVDDKTGRLLTIRRDCLILDGAVCSGERTVGCWFCPREIYAFWREAWVRRVDEPAHSEKSSAPEHSIANVGKP